MDTKPRPPLPDVEGGALFQKLQELDPRNSDHTRTQIFKSAYCPEKPVTQGSSPPFTNTVTRSRFTKYRLQKSHNKLLI